MLTPTPAEILENIALLEEAYQNETKLREALPPFVIAMGPSGSMKEGMRSPYERQLRRLERYRAEIRRREFLLEEHMVFLGQAQYVLENAKGPGEHAIVNRQALFKFFNERLSAGEAQKVLNEYLGPTHCYETCQIVREIGKHAPMMRHMEILLIGIVTELGAEMVAAELGGALAVRVTSEALDQGKVSVPKRTPSSGPLKNASGNLDEAASAARTQPHYPMGVNDIPSEAPRLRDLGRAGRGRGVRETQGTAKDARKLFDELRGENPIREVRPGVFVANAKGGGQVTFRAQSRSGPPTVDVHGIEEGIRKIKFLEEPK